MNLSRKVVLPIVALAVAALGAVLLIVTRPEVAHVTPERTPTTVRVATPEPHDLRMRVRSQGTVAPRTESELIPEVSGPVVWISPALVSGGFFESGDALLRIDARDYQAAAARATASLARAEGELEHARQNLARRRELSEKGISSASQLEDAERTERVAAATREEARVALGQAQRDLERTEVRAPYAGRVRAKHVDVGQFVSRGSPIATLYAIDYVEIRLPIPDRELAYLEMPLFGDASLGSDGPEVELRASFAGAEHVWSGRVVRTEGEIDAKSRMVHVVARVEEPYAATDPARAPLAVGLFVNAEIVGPLVAGVTRVPRSALRGDRELLVVDADDRLRRRPVEVLRVEGDDALLRASFELGDRVCVSPLQAAVEGMRVRAIPSGDDGA